MELPDSTEVLIVGGGPVGLALAHELGLRNINCLLVEKRDGIVSIPKMSVVSTRNMEICRRWGIADEVRAAVWDPDRQLDFVYLEAMVGKELARAPIPSYRDRQRLDYTPEVGCHCPQIYFDPILRREVTKHHSISLLYHTELIEYQEGPDFITATVETNKKTHSVRCKYLIGCDGTNSLIREKLGITLEGLGIVAKSLNIYFRSQTLESIHDKGWARIYRIIDDTGCWSELIPINGSDLWRLTVFDVREHLATPDAYLVRMAGTIFDYEILDVSTWDRRDYIARSYGRSRVFIAGDAAHQCSPTGGLGMATGIEESVNLGWKLAAILRGWGGPQLLDSYEHERRPIAARNVDLSTRSFYAITSIPPWEKGNDPITYTDQWRHNLATYSIPDYLKTQYVYENSPISIPDGKVTIDSLPTSYVPSARPGSRAPHVWISESQTTLDFYDGRFTVVTTDKLADPTPLLAEAKARSIPIHHVFCRHSEVAELHERRMILVRPDGHVAWRGDLISNASKILDRVTGF